MLFLQPNFLCLYLVVCVVAIVCVRLNTCDKEVAYATLFQCDIWNVVSALSQ